MRAGFGVGVIPYWELPPHLQDPIALDFAIWDDGCAYSRFLQHGSLDRPHYAEFSTGTSNPGVAEKVALYRELVPFVWLADAKYRTAHERLLATSFNSLQRNNGHLRQRVGSALSAEGIFYIEVQEESDLRRKVENLFILWRLTQGLPPATDGSTTAQALNPKERRRD
jgi:hypothetical protein